MPLVTLDISELETFAAAVTDALTNHASRITTLEQSGGGGGGGSFPVLTGPEHSLVRINAAGGLEVAPMTAPDVVSNTATLSTASGISLNLNAGNSLRLSTGGALRATLNSGGLSAASANTYDLISWRNVSNMRGAIKQAGNGGANFIHGHADQVITLSGDDSYSVADLLPAGAILLGVSARVNAAITGATEWSMGDASNATRFASASTGLTVGTTVLGMNHVPDSMKQEAAAKVRIYAPGATGGQIRVDVSFLQSTPPVS